MQPFLPDYKGIFKRPGIPRINWEHPLARGLVFYGYDTGDGAILDLARSRLQQLGTGSTLAAPTPSPYGSANNYNTNTYARFFAADAEIKNATANVPYTFACAVFKTGTDSINASPFGRTANNYATTPKANWLFQNNPDIDNGAGKWIISFNDNGNRGTSATWTGGTSNSFMTLMGVARSATAMDFYAQGALQNTTTATAIQSVDTNSNIMFASLGDNSINGPFKGLVYYGAFWARALTASEARQLHTDPYCFLIYPEDDIFSTYAGIGGVNINITGVSGTGSVGVFAINADNSKNITGVSGTGSVGNFSLIIGPTVSVVGVQGIGSVGNFSVTSSVNFNLTGSAGTGSAGVFIIPPTSITITEAAVNRIFQRDPNKTTRDLAISGTLNNGTFTNLNAVVNIVGGGTALTTACTNVVCVGTNWTATVPNVPQGAWYKLTVTEPVGGATKTQINQWGVGICILAIGQSNMQYMWEHDNGAVAATDTYSVRFNGGGWFQIDLTAQGGERDNLQAGAGIVTFTNKLRAALGGTIPIGILEYAIAGTNIASWIIGQSSWTGLVNAVTGLNTTGCSPDFELVLWHQGESDTTMGSTPGSAPTYANQLQTVYTQCQSISGRSNTTLKFGIAMIGPILDVAGTSGPNCDIVRAAQWAAATTTTGMLFIGDTMDFIHLLNDVWHWTQAGNIRAGERYANAVSNLFGISANGSKGPLINNAYWVIGTNKIVIQPSQLSGGGTLLDGTGSSTGTGLTTAQSGFVVTASGGQTISSLALNSGTVVLTMSANRGIGETVTFTYGAGINPWAWVKNPAIDNDNYLIYDNNSALIGDTTGLPLLPSTTSGPTGVITVADTLPAGGGNAWMAGMGKMMNR